MFLAFFAFGNSCPQVTTPINPGGHIIMSTHSSLILRPLSLLAAISALALTTGCANMVDSAPDTNAFSTPGMMSGHIHGGNQPIGGSTVKLYAVGTTGYGSAGTLLATTSSSTDGFATFAFQQVTSGATGPTGKSYVCPSSTTLLYIIASGGNTLNTGTNNNAAAVFLAAVGACGTSASAFIDITEGTSAGSIWALQQYINPGTSTPGSASVGSPSTIQAKLGLANAFATVANLVSVSTGTPIVSTTQTGTGVNLTTTATVTITPEAGKLNTIANILAACVNNATSSATNCTTLFSNAPPPLQSTTSQPSASFPTTPVDTLQAAYYMATNPTNGSTTALANLAALSSATAPFQPTVAATPTDWTMGIAYSSSSVCDGGGNFVAYGYEDSVDAAGNVWMANGGSATNSATTQMSPIGKPLACTAIIGASRGGATIDTNGNVWSASGFAASSTVATNVFKFDGTNTTAIQVGAAGSAVKPYAIHADGAGNVFFTDSGNLKLYELPSTATGATVPTLIGTVTGSSPFHIDIDARETVIIGQSGSGGSTITAYPLTNVGGSTYVASPGMALAQTTGYAGVYGVDFDSSGNFWVGNSAGTSGAGTGPGNTTSYTSIGYSTATSGAAVTASFGTPADVTGIFAGGLSTARIVAVDGANNVWTTDDTAASSGLYAVSEFTHTGVALSPTSTTGTTTVTNNGGYQKAATVLAGPRGIAIDPSGNLWITNTASTANNWVTEMVGAAVPVVTPVSAKIAGNQFGVTP